jgi:hypothetical protein
MESNHEIPDADQALGEHSQRGSEDTAGLKPSVQGFRIRSKGNRLTVTDGPFTEGKELVGGYAMIEVATKDEAMKLAREFMDLHRLHWPEFECECEVRAMEDM